MKICLNDMLYAFSCTLDCVEHDLLGITTRHSERVAYMSSQIGKNMGLDERGLLDLSACAILHDNALGEYIQEEVDKGNEILTHKENLGDFALHCVLGERNAREIPFFGDVENVILYHHENADGSGPFGKKADEVPLYAALIHLTDQLDSVFDFTVMTESKYRELVAFLREKTGSLYAPAHAEAFLDTFGLEKFMEMAANDIDALLAGSLPRIFADYRPAQVVAFSTIFARIADYKSRFTRNHSVGIAEKAGIMGAYYRFDDELRAKFYLAAALHDIGKLMVDIEVLEKPERLTAEEYHAIQKHAVYSHNILRRVQGFEDITLWASRHHEKLNGKGYPFGLSAQDLGFYERLMGCLDIYQALVEDRPYKDKMTHRDAVMELTYMARHGLIDENIVEDINDALKEQNAPADCP